MTWKNITLITVLLILIYLVYRLKPGIRNITNTLPKHPTKKFRERELFQIQQIVIHHTAGPEAQTPSDIAKYHIGPNQISITGIAGIAYHYVIDRAGVAYQTQGLRTISTHIRNQNTKSIGIAFIGNYNEISPTKSQLNAAKAVINDIHRKVGRKLALTNHSDACNGCTDCPGYNLDIEPGTEF